MTTLEQLKYEPQPIPIRPKAPFKPSPLTDQGTMLASQVSERKSFPPFRPTYSTVKTIATPLFNEMEPFERTPIIPIEMRRNVYPGTSNVPSYLRG